MLGSKRGEIWPDGMGEILERNICILNQERVEN